MLSDDAFTEWLRSIDAPLRSRDLALMTGESPAKLRAQRVRSRVSWASVVSVSRALNRHPVDDLRSFHEFEHVDRRQKPLQAEVLSQVHAEDIFLEVAKRRRPHVASLLGAAGYELGRFPFDESTRFWIEAIDRTGSLRKDLIGVTKLDSTALSRAIRSNSINPEHSILVARIAGATPTVGLVVSGLISAAEAGWSPTQREMALLECSDSDLVDIADARLKSLRKNVRAADAEHHYWQTLG